MTSLRFSAGVLVMSSLLAVGWIIGAGGCGQSNVRIYACGQGTPGELGADGGPDPCHCNPPNATQGCPCTDPNEFNGSGFTGKQLYQFCLQSLEDGGEGGPLPACTGQCWPEGPLEWSLPLLLCAGQPDLAPSCSQQIAPVVLYDGQADGAVAVACTSTASGTCPGLQNVCGPGGVDGCWTCVSHDGDHACVSESPYTAPHVFDSDTFGPTTFCCLDPQPPPMQPPPMPQ